MIIRVCYFTEQGRQLADRLFDNWEEVIREDRDRELSLEEWTGSCFERHLPILWIGACGIAVRAIAPSVKDKLEDSPVLVMDEKGNYVIPILSGHVGGANELAKQIAEKTGAQPVLTTATDVEGLFSPDSFAVKNGLRIENREEIRRVSGKLLRGQQIRIAVDPSFHLPMQELPRELMPVPWGEAADIRIQILHGDRRGGEEKELLLTEKPYIAGMGCKKGKDFEECRAFLEEHCPREYLENLSALASINLKKKEKGLVGLAQFERIPFYTYGADELTELTGEFTASSFVSRTVGVDNVCERAAMKCAGEKGKLVLSKIAGNGITLAIAEKRPVINCWR